MEFAAPSHDFSHGQPAVGQIDGAGTQRQAERAGVYDYGPRGVMPDGGTMNVAREDEPGLGQMFLGEGGHCVRPCLPGAQYPPASIRWPKRIGEVAPEMLQGVTF